MQADRRAAREEFLHAAGWGGAVMHALPGDASTRHYARIEQGGRSAMLMDQPQHAEAQTAPAGATPDERRALGYNALARLAGGDCGRFVAVADYLRTQGFSTPEILAADKAQGLVLLEDLGDALYTDTLAAGADEPALYRAAVEVLAKLHAVPAPAAVAGMDLHAYDETAMLAETDLLTEWYVPLALGRQPSAEETAEHRALWRAALKPVLETPPVFVHRDYHAQNLIWLPQRQGIARVGLIDFQDAVAASRAYDLVSLLEDARRDVAPALGEAMTRHYLAAMRAQGMPLDEEKFRAEMAAVAAQRNAKIAGIFARLDLRDGKPRYLAHLPRVWNYLERDLAHPALAPLRQWYDRTIPQKMRMGAAP